MTHVDVLRGQATVLWRLAKSFDIPLRPARACHSVRGAGGGSDAQGS
jgi:hypothetical protein